MNILTLLNPDQVTKAKSGFKGHVALLNILQIRICIAIPVLFAGPIFLELINCILKAIFNRCISKT